jgi:hypothetical protein
MLIGSASAGIGFAVATANSKNTLGRVLLQHASATVIAAESPALRGQAAHERLQLDIMTTLTQVAMLQPDVASLNAYELEGLCLLTQAVERNTVGFGEEQLEMVGLTRPYIEAVSAELDARLASTDPILLQPGCRAAQQGIRPNSHTSDTSTG